MDLAGGTLEFENELTLTPVQNFKNVSSTSETYDYDGLRFGRIDNTTEIRLTTPFIDVYLKPSMYICNYFGYNNTFTSYLHKGEKYNDGRFFLSLNECDITVKPFEKVWFGFQNEFYTPGSYLPVTEKNVSYGALGTDFSLLFMPTEGLRITAGLPSGNYIYNFGYDTRLNKDGKYTDETKPTINTGIEYTYDESLCFAFTIRDLLFNKFYYQDYNESYDNPYYTTIFGFYGSFDANKWLGQDLTIHAGYACMANNSYPFSPLEYNSDCLSTSIEWKNDWLTLAAEGIFRLTLSEYTKRTSSPEQQIRNPYNLAFKAGYNVNRNWLTECTFLVDKYAEHYSSGENCYSVIPEMTYTFDDHNQFSAGFNYAFWTQRWNTSKAQYEDGQKTFSLNLGWTYKL